MVSHRQSSSKIGRKLREIRKRRGLMQIDVAVATNLDRAYISRIETGKARVTIHLLSQIVKGLEITSKDLLEQYA